jgi:hypothetical protein
VSFFRCSSAFFSITRSAGTDDVLPRSSSPLTARYYMIEGSLLGCQLFAAILARKVVSG